jgi:hypothetical protein
MACYGDLDGEEDEGYFWLPDCKEALCGGCAQNFLVGQRHGDGPITCPCPQKDALNLSAGMMRVVKSKCTAAEAKRMFARCLKSHGTFYRPQCPMCYAECRVRFGCKRFVCEEADCINPEYGYCARCHRGVTREPHDCQTDDLRETFKLLQENADCMPCPRCKTWYMKDDGCAHVVCKKPGCYTHFCAICGEEGKASNGGVYGHTCKAGDLLYRTRTPQALAAIRSRLSQEDIEAAATRLRTGP